MVSITVVSRNGADIIPPNESNRKIAGEPLYRPEEVLELLADAASHPVVAWTRMCIENTQGLGFSQKDFCALLRLAVSSGRFRGAEWCIQSGDGPWAACDAYSVVRREWIANAHKEMAIEYYVKFAIAKSGTKILLASCHL